MIYYSKEHLWLEAEGESAVIGLTGYAVEKLGSLVFVNLPETGDSLSVGEKFGDVESIKTVSDLISPIDGQVTEANEALLDEPECLAENPSETWLMKAHIQRLADGLMNREQYAAYIEKL